MGTDLAPTESMGLPRGRLTLVVSYDQPGTSIGVQLYALVLGSGDKVRSAGGVVSASQPDSADGVRWDGTTTFGPRVQHRISLNAADFTSGARGIVFALAVETGGLNNLANVRANLIGPDGTIHATFEVGGVASIATSACLVVARVYKRLGMWWRIQCEAQDYTSLAALATAFGAGATSSVPEAAVPAGPLGEFDTRKHVVSLAKQEAGIPADQRMRVALALDVSGSAYELYASGKVQLLLERLLPVAHSFNPRQPVPVWYFGTNPVLAKVLLTLANLAGYIKATLPGAVEREAGTENNEHRVIAAIRKWVRNNPSPLPTLVLFMSDGGVGIGGEPDTNEKINKELRDASREPIFWGFMGYGRADYGALQVLNNLTGRAVDSTGFFSADDIAALTDQMLYRRILAADLAKWLVAARGLNIIR